MLSLSACAAVYSEKPLSFLLYVCPKNWCWKFVGLMFLPQILNKYEFFQFSQYTVALERLREWKISISPLLAWRYCSAFRISRIKCRLGCMEIETIYRQKSIMGKWYKELFYSISNNIKSFISNSILLSISLRFLHFKILPSCYAFVFFLWGALLSV